MEVAVESANSLPRILFLCTGNSCRSQMAEGWAREFYSDRLAAYSAGVKPTGLNPDAVRVMREIGVDISSQRSKCVDELSGISFDCVITVCDDAKEVCPVFPNALKVVHRSFDDPPRIANEDATEDERLMPYRRVRDEIRDFVSKLPDALISARSANADRKKGCLP